MEYIDITEAFALLSAMLGAALGWAKTHGVTLGTFSFSFFELGISGVVMLIIIYNLPPFRDDYDDWATNQQEDDD